MTDEMAKRYVFLDRDGVINKDSPYFIMFGCRKRK